MAARVSPDERVSATPVRRDEILAAVAAATARVRASTRRAPPPGASPASVAASAGSTLAGIGVDVLARASFPELTVDVVACRSDSRPSATSVFARARNTPTSSRARIAHHAPSETRRTSWTPSPPPHTSTSRTTIPPRDTRSPPRAFSFAADPTSSPSSTDSSSRGSPPCRTRRDSRDSPPSFSSRRATRWRVEPARRRSSCTPSRGRTRRKYAARPRGGTPRPETQTRTRTETTTGTRIAPKRRLRSAESSREDGHSHPSTTRKRTKRTGTTRAMRDGQSHPSTNPRRRSRSRRTRIVERRASTARCASPPPRRFARCASPTNRTTRSLSPPSPRRFARRFFLPSRARRVSAGWSARASAEASPTTRFSAASSRWREFRQTRPSKSRARRTRSTRERSRTPRRETPSSSSSREPSRHFFASRKRWTGT